MLVAGPSQAGSEARFGPAPPVYISFVQFQSPDLTKPSGTMLTIKGKLSVPGDVALPQGGTGQQGKRKRPAVLILPGSAGVGDEVHRHVVVPDLHRGRCAAREAGP